jgi:hypothetical protein
MFKDEPAPHWYDPVVSPSRTKLQRPVISASCDPYQLEISSPTTSTARPFEPSTASANVVYVSP